MSHNAFEFSVFEKEEKLLVFSQSLEMLGLLEKFVAVLIQKSSIFHISGQKSAIDRAQSIKAFR